MDVNMQGVMRFSNQQATNPHLPFTGNAASAAVPAREEPPDEPVPAPAPEKEQAPNG